MNPDGVPRPIPGFESAVPDMSRSIGINGCLKLADAPLHGLIELLHRCAPADRRRPTPRATALECENALGHLLSEDIPVVDNRPIQARPLQPGIDEPREWIAATGAALDEQHRHRGGEFRRQRGEPSALLLNLGSCPMDTRQPYRVDRWRYPSPNLRPCSNGDEPSLGTDPGAGRGTVPSSTRTSSWFILGEALSAVHVTSPHKCCHQAGAAGLFSTMWSESQEGGLAGIDPGLPSWTQL